MSSALALSTAKGSSSAPTLMIASCCAFGSLSKIGFDISSGSNMNQYDLPRPLVRNFDTSSRRNEMRLVDDVSAASIAPVCIAA